MTPIGKIKFLLTRIYNSFIMITEDNIATAQIAQMFGSELLRVQEGARTDSGSQPNILNIDPKTFLMANSSSPQSRVATYRKPDEEQMIRMLQQQAENTHPLPPPVSLPQEDPAIQTKQPNAIRSPEPTFTGAGSDSLERIAASLERIANCLENTDLTIKKKRRKPKQLLNENRSK
jgi:hypothetical protein